jgi:geranylgeranyl pyrophosphate synthase
LRRDVETWFEPAALDEIFGGPAGTPAERIAREWLSRAGKRWRPFLTVCAYKAMQADPDAPLPVGLRQIAVAVECFHKASLIHDDIEDEDAQRYGAATLHTEQGVPIALNVGDLLVGEGYRLLAACDAPAEVRSSILRIAAEGHRQLCLGQGDELEWTRHPRVLTSGEVVEIFRRKTAPAFEVALRLGVAYAGGDEEIHATLTKYSEALGIAYQIRDDLEDLDEEAAADDGRPTRPSLPLSAAYERTAGEAKDLIVRGWHRDAEVDRATLRRIIHDSGADERCRTQLERYKELAIRALPELQNPSLKGLLRRVVGKIFKVEIKGWCSEFEARNAAGGATRAAAAR